MEKLLWTNGKTSTATSGRNGTVKTTGLQFEVKDGTVAVTPLNSKGKAASLSIELPFSALGELVKLGTRAKKELA